jgi:cell division protein ZapE
VSPAAGRTKPPQRPSELYAAGIAAGHWLDDPAQRAVLPALDRLHEAASTGRAGFWQRLHRRPAPRGLYLFGPVGRGKTLLLDLLAASLPPDVGERIHFHRFMRAVHADLAALDGERDPLRTVAARLAARVRVLCLDEFFVSDIGDAMILGNLLAALLSRGVMLATTSNTAPAALYRDGLQRERFLPAIALIQRHCETVELASPTDWRLRALRQAPVYQTPPGPAAERVRAAIFQRVASGPVREDFALELNGRTLLVKREADGVIWFRFAALCEGPRAVADYIEIARDWHTVLVSNVPQFTPQTEDAARRFIELVDEFYDRAVNLVVSAAAPIVELYDGERLRAEFARTQSRLIEMQSEDYLKRAHCG